MPSDDYDGVYIYEPSYEALTKVQIIPWLGFMSDKERSMMVPDLLLMMM